MEQGRSAAAGKAAVRDPSPAADILERAATKPIADLSKTVDEAVDRHGFATAFRETSVVEVEGCPVLPAAERARARLLGIQSQPSLARLFNLVVDVLIPLDDVESVVHSSLEVEVKAGDTNRVRFAFLSGVIDGLGATRQVWTAAKARLSNEGGPDAFVCTQDEIEAALDAATPAPTRARSLAGPSSSSTATCRSPRTRRRTANRTTVSTSRRSISVRVWTTGGRPCPTRKRRGASS